MSDSATTKEDVLSTPLRTNNNTMMTTAVESIAIEKTHSNDMAAIIKIMGPDDTTSNQVQQSITFTDLLLCFNTKVIISSIQLLLIQRLAEYNVYQ